MDDLPPRLRAVCDLSMAEMREYCGRHEYDGRIQDLSQAGVSLGDLELHRRNPLRHLAMLDLACYDRDYAPEADRSRARLAHLSGWPQAADAAIDALDQVSAPVAAALTSAIRGLAAGIPADAAEQARAAEIGRAHV